MEGNSLTFRVSLLQRFHVLIFLYEAIDDAASIIMNEFWKRLNYSQVFPIARTRFWGYFSGILCYYLCSLLRFLFNVLWYHALPADFRRLSLESFILIIRTLITVVIVEREAPFHEQTSYAFDYRRIFFFIAELFSFVIDRFVPAPQILLRLRDNAYLCFRSKKMLCDSRKSAVILKVSLRLAESCLCETHLNNKIQ